MPTTTTSTSKKRATKRRTVKRADPNAPVVQRVKKNAYRDVALLTFRWVYTHVVNYKTPLVLANVTQASQVGTYIYKTAPTESNWFNMIVAICAAAAFDLTVVATAFLPKRTKRDWIAAVITSLSAFVFSAGISWQLTGDVLHIGAALVVLTFSWLLAFQER